MIPIPTNVPVCWNNPMRRLLPPVVVVVIAGLAGCSDVSQPKADISEADADTGWVEVGPTRLFYEARGSGPAVVLIHGGFLDHTMWDPQMPALADSNRVIRFDVRGHGKSAAVPDTFSHHEDLRKLISQLELDRPVLVGHSLGGRIAIDYALAYPDESGALVLVGPGLSGFALDSPELAEFSTQASQAHSSGDYDLATEFFQRAWTDGPSRTPEDVDPGVREKVRALIRYNAQRWRPESVVAHLDPPATDRLADISVPMLIIVPELDMPDILEIAAMLEAQVSDVRIVRIPNAAHMVNLETPARFEQVLLEFLREEGY